MMTDPLALAVIGNSIVRAVEAPISVPDEWCWPLAPKVVFAPSRL